MTRETARQRASYEAGCRRWTVEIVASSLYQPTLSSQGHLTSIIGSSPQIPTTSLLFAVAPPCKDCHYHDGHASNANRCRNQLVVAPVGAPGPRREKMGSRAASGRLVHCARHRGSQTHLEGFSKPLSERISSSVLLLFHPEKLYSHQFLQTEQLSWENRKRGSRVVVDLDAGKPSASGGAPLLNRVPYRSALLQSVRRDAPVRMRSAV